MPLKAASRAILATLAVAVPAHAGDLRVEVRGLEAKTGTVNIALFNSAETFVKMTRLAGQLVPANADAAIAVFPNLAPGDYAVSVFHDVNSNGQLDKNVLGRPTEPFGFSRDASGFMGPPTFDAAKIAVGAEDVSIIINLR